MIEKSILDELLKDEIAFKTNEEEDKILAPLLEEINLISNQQIKLFIRSVLFKAKTFWEIPSSFSGKSPTINLFVGRLMNLTGICKTYL